MSSPHRHLPRTTAALAATAAIALTLAACGNSATTTSSGSGGTSALTIGTTDKITALDPAGSYDNGSFAVMNQVFPFLMNTPLGSPEVKPDIATSASFTSPTTYTVKLKPGLKWANGHDLTSSDVKFTFDRQLKIADANGPSSLLGNLAGTADPDPTTVVFTLKTPNDQTFPQVLSSPAGPIVDEQVFSPTKVTPDKDIVAGKAFAGQYMISSYAFNSLIQYKAYEGYQGLLGPAKTATVNVKYYADASNLKLDVGTNAIDVAFRSLSATDIANLRTNNKVKVVDGPGGEIRYIVSTSTLRPTAPRPPTRVRPRRWPYARPRRI